MEATPDRELDLEVRPLLDELIVDKATDFIEREAKGDRPFFTYVALSTCPRRRRRTPTSTRPIRGAWDSTPT